MPTVLSPKPKTPHARGSDGRTSSPNYFGLTVDPANSTTVSSASRFAKNSKSPSSSIRTSAGSAPHDLPFHPSQNYSAFRKQSEKNNHFSISESSLRSLGSSPVITKSSPTYSSSNSDRSKPLKPLLGSVDSGSESECQQVKRSPKRSLSPGVAEESSSPVRRSKETLGYQSPERSRAIGSPTSRDEKQPRLSLPGSSPGLLSSPGLPRSETLPPTFEEDTGPALTTPQHVANMLDSYSEEALILDLRVSTQYARASIRGALNLCIPTTLLKRPAYNIQRLADTFGDQDQRIKFERWPSCKCIILYDTSSTQMKEATNCLNILKKFTSEGWNGCSYILRGGFSVFAKKFPSYVEENRGAQKVSNTGYETLATDNDAIAPVVGGCPMPATKNAANPFFGNIRQNTDLIGGVGQMSLKRPPNMDPSELPTWLRTAAAEENEGKLVSDKFYDIEKREQKRMQGALSGDVVYGTPGPQQREQQKQFQIAGIEKGSKNRYNNIWPFEHTRVKLESVPSNGCDYINANHVATRLSNKRYIATQGPIPATFRDFWNMIWQNDVRVIVMLTAEKEGGQIKAHNYWSETRFDQLQLTVLSESRESLELTKFHRQHSRPSMGGRRSSMNPRSTGGGDATVDDKAGDGTTSDQAHVIVRKFSLRHDGQPFEPVREITQLQYSSWPDFGAPAHPMHLLGLVERCDATVRAARSSSSGDSTSSAAPDPPDQRPVLVHCSAGCGRTGTFCTVDSVIDMMKRQRLSTSKNTPPKTYSGSSTNPSTTQRSDNDKNQRAAHAVEKNNEWVVPSDMDLVEKTVEEFRLQRLSMVQSLRQFVLCYESVLEWFVRQEGLKGA